MPIPSDKDLIASILRGDGVAFRIWVERHQASVFALAYRITDHTGIAEEIAQETFLRAYQALGTYQEQGSARNWLLKLCQRLSLDALRRIRPTLPLADEQSETFPASLVPTSAPSPEESAIRAEQRSHLEEALQTLRPEYRAMIQLRHLEDRTYEEIAEILQIPLGTVKTHLHRARSELRAILSHRGHAP